MMAERGEVALSGRRDRDLLRFTLTNQSSALDPGGFLQRHRGYLVSVDRIVRIDANTKDTRVEVLSDGSKIPVRRGGYARFREIVQ